MPQSLRTVLQERVHPLKKPSDFQSLIEEVKDARIVMLGEATHGTHEFYELRRILSEELILHHDFRFIAVEGDWPPCAAIDQWMTTVRPKRTALEALREFKRWPTWMWANHETAALISHLRDLNRTLPHHAHFHGLDVYSFFESMDAAITQLMEIDPRIAEELRSHYSCFDPHLRNEKVYARSLINDRRGCQDAVVDALTLLLEARLPTSRDEAFNAEQNARIVKNAESYYRAMVLGEDDSWNIRDEHMLETLDELLQHHGPGTKGIVWAHNTHIGDYRATTMVDWGQVNLGGLARERWGEDQVKLVGFASYRGEVIASHAWGGPTQKMMLPTPPEESWEAVMHEISREAASNSIWFSFLDPRARRGALSLKRGHRAVGVVYDPSQDRRHNYVPTSLSERYDALIFVDRTSALRPIDAPIAREEFPATYPSGD